MRLQRTTALVKVDALFISLIGARDALESQNEVQLEGEAGAAVGQVSTERLYHRRLAVQK